MSLTLTSRVDKNRKSLLFEKRARGVWILVGEVGYGHAPILTTTPKRHGALFR